VPVATVTWSAPADPADIKDYSLTWSNLLAGTETLTTSGWSLDATSVAAGVEVDHHDHTDTAAVLWVRAAVSEQNDVVFEPPGITAYATNTVTTSGGRTYQVSASWPVRQR
jgi:hypothetical protein